MARAFFYFTLPLLDFILWGVILLTGYFAYRDNDPFFLEGDYLRLFIGNREKLLIFELLIPLGLCLAFLVVFLFKLFYRRIRLVLGIFQLMGLEYFVYRQFFFSDQYADYQDGFNLGVPVEFLEQPGYWPELVISGIAFLLLVLIKEERRISVGPNL